MVDSSPATDASNQPSTSTASQPQEYKLPSYLKPSRTFHQLTLPTHEQVIFQDIMDNCFVKSALSCAMGGVAGLAFGLFSASLDNAGGGLESQQLVEHADRPTRVVLKEMALHMKNKSLSFAKSFAVLGALYSFNECVIEKYRGKHDKVNPALAGCATGGMLAYAAGPQAMCLGCASFAAFSTAIEYFLESH